MNTLFLLDATTIPGVKILDSEQAAAAYGADTGASDRSF